MKHLLSLLLACTALFGAAQPIPPVFHFKRAVSINPSVFLGPDYTALFGVEQRMKKNFSFVLDAGYVFGSAYFNNQNVLQGARGFSVRPGIKAYGNDRKKFYGQLQVFYKQVDYTLNNWLGKNCVNNTPAYRQLQTFTYRKTAVSANLMAGHLFRLSDFLLLEVYEGIGVKIKEQKPTEANACYRNNEGGFLNGIFSAHSVTPNVPVGIKLLYAIR